MPLTDASLKTKIKTEIEALNGVADDPNILDKFAEAIAKAVVDEMKNEAVTETVIAGGSSAGTYPGTVS